MKVFHVPGGQLVTHNWCEDDMTLELLDNDISFAVTDADDTEQLEYQLRGQAAIACDQCNDDLVLER